MKPIVLAVMLCCAGRAQVRDRALYGELDRELASVLEAARFTGTAGSQLERRLGAGTATAREWRGSAFAGNRCPE